MPRSCFNFVTLLWVLNGVGCGGAPEGPAGSSEGGLPHKDGSAEDDLEGRAGDSMVDAATDGGADAPLYKACPSPLPVQQTYDAERAARGRALLKDETLARGVLPEAVVRNLWVAWGTFPVASDQEFWKQFRSRYGMLEAPFDNGGLPLGMRREAGGLTFDCMLCHGGRIAGITMLGSANGTVDLESFYDDLLIMRDKAPSFGFPAPPVPYDLDGLTFAVGAQDAFGLGFRFAGPLASGANTDFGPQKPQAWWLLKHKQRIYADGAGDASGYHNMVATLVAFGITPSELAARDGDFLDIAHYARSIEPPCWTLSALDPQKAAQGKEVFEAHCASCHGVPSGDEASYPNMVVDVGTDPIRAERFGEAEAARLNLTWFGDPPFEPTGAYLAPPLTGIWARAPYFHNGSVPTLMGVLDSSQRPTYWRRAGAEVKDYDVERVGLRYTEVSEAPDPDTRAGRLVYDTTRESMGNGGHTFGDSLTIEERENLLEYLRGL